MISRSISSDDDLKRFALMVSNGEKAEHLAKIFNISERTVYALRRKLIANGSIKIDEKGKPLRTVVVEGERMTQILTGPTRVIRFNDNWRPERTMRCEVKSDIGSGMSMLMPNFD
jgi:transposase